MRDLRRYKFNGQECGKGRIVLEVVRKYVEQHPEAGFEELKRTFPDDLQKTGAAAQFSTDGQCVIKRRKDVTDEKRFHMNKKDQIELMGEQVVVSREWNINNIQNFITKAYDLGFEIEML